MGDIIVRLLSLPNKVRAFTIPDNGDYVILLNSNLTAEMQKESYEHELNHIMNGDYDNIYTNIDELELIRH